MSSTGKSEPRGRRFPGEALQKTHRRDRHGYEREKENQKKEVLEECLISVRALDAISALEAAAGGRASESRKWWQEEKVYDTRRFSA